MPLSRLLDTANTLIVVFVLQNDGGKMFPLLVMFLVYNNSLELLLCREMNIGCT
jgi:hypothetical protein